MWKAIVDAVIESFVYVDPMVYMYYITAKRQSELPTEAAPSEASRDRAVELRLAEASRVQEEALHEHGWPA